MLDILSEGDGASVIDSRKCEAAARIIVDCCQNESDREQHFHALAPQVVLICNYWIFSHLLLIIIFSFINTVLWLCSYFCFFWCSVRFCVAEDSKAWKFASVSFHVSVKGLIQKTDDLLGFSLHWIVELLYTWLIEYVKYIASWKNLPYILHRDWQNLHCIFTIATCNNDCLTCLQIVSLLRGGTVRGSVDRAVVAIAEGMHARHSDVTAELVAKPLLEPLLKCLESTGRVTIVH